MKLLKPNWVSHDEKPIFSIDIHPAGSRFATGGQGGDSGRVVVWNLNAVLEESVEQDSTVPKMLCQMDNHLACVNCVRWSCGGQYLASGGDDKIIMIWKLSSAGSSTVFGGNGKMNVETWRCVSTLRGHAGDILDLSWSPLDKWLASCSVDNSIIIWNAENFPDMICVLQGHSGLVKGVAWDPVGKYLASQSDDKSLRIWKTVDWTQEAVVTEPFEECGGTTHVLRLSWSPDGQYVVSAHAMNGGGPTAQIIERDGWRCDKDFVGHRKAVTCVRFNSNILGRCLENGGRGPQCYCCVAIGSRDRTLSVWCTALKRPLVVIHELFTDSVLDLSWSTDGLNLLACSWDGTVASIQFTKEEIGLPLSNQEKNALYERMYGKSLACANDHDLSSATLLIESPEILRVREEIENKESTKAAITQSSSPENKLKSTTSNSNSVEEKPTPNLNTTVTSSSLESPVRPTNRQIETRTSDGKRRITPMFIPLHHLTDHNEINNATNTDGCFSTSSQSKSKIIVEKRDDIIIVPNVSNHASVLPPAPQGPNNFTGVTKPPPENELDGRLKRRGDNLPGPKVNEVSKKQKVTPTKQKSECMTVKSVTIHDTGGRLAMPTLGTAGPIVRHAGKFRVQVLNNACNTPHGKLTRIQLLPGNSASNDPIWESFLGSPCSSIACDSNWICVGCEDATLHCLETNTGRKEVGIIALGAPAARLSLITIPPNTGSAHLCAITTAAAVTVWNLVERTCALSPVSLRYLMPEGVNVSSCSLMDDGNPMISLTNGKGYVYSKKMSAWIIGCDGNDPLWRCARVGSGRPLVSMPSSGPAPLTSLQHATLRGSSSTGHQSHYQQGNHSGAIQSYLEGQLATSKLINSPTEYKHWLLALVSHLMQQGPEARLRCILDDLMGPSHCTSLSEKWSSTVLDHKKHDLLDDILILLGKQLRWQRMYIEYSEQISAIKETLTNGK
ncbi:histone cell cycle regulator-like protein [Arctopsyche grandis]|uniref:histone cell cycle regulator-like protein n=1 Tax=Arctopsyche grandis TaxID=121162 RepID=UPI00406D7F16